MYKNERVTAAMDKKKFSVRKAHKDRKRARSASSITEIRRNGMA